MVNKIAATLVTAIVIALAGTAPAHAYTPQPGAAFNDPTGDRAAQNRLAVRVRETIRSVPKHGIIRIASYSFDRPDIADALIAACNRRVTVQIVLNDNWTSPATNRMRRHMGSQINPHWSDRCHPRKKPDNPDSTRKPYIHPSFVKICVSACRGRAGNQHMKFFAFSRAGGASNIIMTGSVNLTEYAASTHWNDMYTAVGKKAMFVDYGRIFRQLAEDRPVRTRYVRYTHGALVTEFGARWRTTRTNDPVMERLARVRCRTTGSSGVNGRTMIRIAMYAWGGERGTYIARRVAELDRNGCTVIAILSNAGAVVRDVLRRGGVSFRSASVDLDNNPNTGFGDTPWERFTHEKWMSLNGMWAGRAQRIVWTGSENWSNLSRINDEVTLKVPYASAHRAYANHFDYVWRRTR